MLKNAKSWTVSDELWAKAEPLIPARVRPAGVQYRRAPGGGRKPKSPRVVFEAIVYVLRTGVQWSAIPKEFGSPSAIHRYFLEWSESGFFERLWEAGLAEYDGMEGIGWAWQSVDGSMVKAPLATECVGPNPTDRGKKWAQAKRVVRRAWRPVVPRRVRWNRHDSKLLEATLDEAPASRPEPDEANPQHLCLDAGYAGVPCLKVVESHGFVAHVRPRNIEAQELKKDPGAKARRWVVERAHA